MIYHFFKTYALIGAAMAMGYAYGYFVGTNDITRYLVVALEALAIGFLVSHIYYSLRVRHEERRMEKHLAAIRTIMEEAHRQVTALGVTPEPGDTPAHTMGFPTNKKAGPE